MTEPKSPALSTPDGEWGTKAPASVQDRPPNFRVPNGSLYLVRCFVCDSANGRENWAPNVANGACTWCGWTETESEITGG